MKWEERGASGSSLKSRRQTSNSFQAGTGSLREEGRIYKEGQLVRKAGGGWQCYF